MRLDASEYLLLRKNIYFNSPLSHFYSSRGLVKEAKEVLVHAFKGQLFFFLYQFTEKLQYKY